MKNPIKVIDKGYTLAVTSWENDGDYERVQTHCVDNIEDAELIYRLCTELFTSRGVGNSLEGEEDYKILEYVKDNPNLFSGFHPETNFIDLIYNLGHELMGGSNDYDFRVCESCVVTYSPEDIYVEQVIF